MNADQCDSKERWQYLLPEFAPLSSPFVAFLFAHPEKFDAFSAFSYNEDDPLFERIWANIQIARANVLSYVHPIMHAPKAALDERLSTTWLYKALKGFDSLHQSPPRQTVANWQARNLLRTWGFGIPEPNSAASLLILRSLTSLRRDWLPSDVKREEPWFWIWGQKSGETRPKRYPWPLPDGIDPATLLYTTWRGAAWLPGWKGVRHYGAIAWAKTIQCGDVLCWHLSQPELALWDRDFMEEAHLPFEQSPSFPGFPMEPLENDEYELLRLHDLADKLLSQVGEPLLYSHLEHFYSQRLPPVSMER